MITSRICVFLIAGMIFASCGSPQTAEHEDTTNNTTQEKIAETPELEGTTLDTSYSTVTESADNVSDEKTAATTPPVDEKRISQSTSKEIEKINVSFFSIGEGIDFDALKEYKSFIDSYKTASGKSLTYETINWGREGETDFCFDMTNISDNESKKFLNETREKLKDNKLVNIELNQKCKEQRIRK